MDWLVRIIIFDQMVVLTAPSLIYKRVSSLEKKHPKMLFFIFYFLILGEFIFHFKQLVLNLFI